MRASTPWSAIALRTAAQRRSSSAVDIGLSNLSFIFRKSWLDHDRGRSNAVEGTKPIDKFPDADGNRGMRGKSDRFAQVLHVRAGFPNVARLHRHQLPYRLLAERGFKQTYHLQEIDRGVIADVIDPPRRAAGRRIRMIARPHDIFLRHMIDKLDDGGRDIIHIGEIPPHIAAVEQLDRPALENRRRK